MPNPGNLAAVSAKKIAPGEKNGYEIGPNFFPIPFLLLETAGGALPKDDREVDGPCRQFYHRVIGLTDGLRQPPVIHT